MCLKQQYYLTEASGTYKRGYLPEMELECQCFADFKEKEIKIYVSKFFFVILFNLVMLFFCVIANDTKQNY